MSRKLRKQNFIDNHVQGALLRRILSHWLMFFGVSGFAVILLQTLLGDPSLSIMERMQQQMGEFVFFAIVMVAMFPAFMLDTIRFSNRFVGPIARVRRHLRQLSEGDTSACAFRGDDFWTDMADEFNKVADLVKSQQEEIERLKELSGEKTTA
ncbi:MAG: hypothetical protein AAFN77_17520 [Planctomycetota bacterium]